MTSACCAALDLLLGGEGEEAEEAARAERFELLGLLAALVLGEREAEVEPRAVGERRACTVSATERGLSFTTGSPETGEIVVPMRA